MSQDARFAYDTAVRHVSYNAVDQLDGSGPGVGRSIDLASLDTRHAFKFTIIMWGLMMKKILLSIACVAASTAAVAQTNYADWADNGRPDFTLNGDVAPADNLGGVTPFTDQAAFLAATNVVTETFNNGATAAGAVNTCTEPVSSASNDVCFAPGDLAAGFSMTSDNGGGIVVLGSTFLGANQTTPVAGANTFTDITEIAFSPAITAIGVDTLIGAPGPGDVTLTAFDGGGATLGNITITTTAVDTAVFAGLTSGTPIASITLEGIGGGGELIDNLYFGTTGTALPEPAEVPTLSNAALWALIALMLAGGAWFATRRQTQA
ncbi:MAG: hypothetical protein Tsb002_06160 [Wenzhouxiangellaceae bacterium]